MPSRDGLDDAQVAERVRLGLVNRVDDASSRSFGSILRANVLTLFNGIVLGAFGLLLVLGHWQDALFGFAAISNAIIGVVQEYHAKRQLDRLALMHAPKARVRRGGRLLELATADVVRDDRLVLRAGDQVTADGVVLECVRLEADESLLTGESDPVAKHVGDGVLSGSIIVGGEAEIVVTAVGADAFASKLSAEAKRFSLVSSELRNSINRILKWITWMIFPIMLLVINSNMQAAGGWVEAIESGAWNSAAVASIAAVIAMIPLGLVLMTSIAFAVGAIKLGSHNVLVQELAGVEGLARVDLICLDKTGTITTGEIVFDAAHPVGEPPAGWEAVLARLGADPAANNTAKSLATRFTDASGLEPLAEIEFSSARKWSALTFGSGSAAPGTWVLGAAEYVLALAEDGRPGGDPALAELGERAQALAASGLRTLLLSRSAEVLDAAAVRDARLPGGVEPVALLTLKEQVRDDAAETLRYFAAEGVAVRIISGDNPATVAAVAREVGLEAGDGVDARDLPDELFALGGILEEQLVFGRVSPTQKRSMVHALQARGRTVAMTGDGVNDALAIKDADIGIAMESGSDATKAVARLVLLDSKFSHLPAVVAEGRRVIANIERVSMLFLSKTSYAITMGIVFGLLLWPFPFLPRQLSITDGLTIGLPAFLLALLPNSRRYVPGFLKRSLSFAIPAGLVVATGIVVASGRARAAGESEDIVRSLCVVLLSILGLWILVVLSRPFSWVKAGVVALMVLGLVAVYTVPALVWFFELVALTPRDFLDLAVIAPIGILLIELIALWHRRRFGVRGTST
ncbi:HAD-IC family P-type ATPase [Agromyces seonyuensis]|uniref:HAD-IC family P-type ATPase n=1 Tax=Agromyces seonyuensis TaxID=2662446 RepID=UPI0030146B1D